MSTENLRLALYAPAPSHDECTTMLAALRYFQQAREEGTLNAYEMEYFEDGTQPLSMEEIDKLCERIALTNLPPGAQMPTLAQDDTPTAPVQQYLIVAFFDTDASSYTHRVKLALAPNSGFDIDDAKRYLFAVDTKGVTHQYPLVNVKEWYVTRENVNFYG